MNNRLAARRLAAILSAGATVLAVTAVTGAASANGPGHVLPDSKPHWVGHARTTGRVPDSAHLNFGVLLKMRHQATADNLVRQLSDPASSRYGHWLTSAQFRSSFGPAHSDVAAVQSWLRQQGFSVTGTLRSGLLVQAEGTAAQVDRAFSTTMTQYRFRGHSVHANATALTLPQSTPAAVTGAIDGIVGLDQGSTMKKPLDTLPGPPDGFRPGTPCSRYFGQKIATSKPPADGRHQPWDTCGYTPQQLQGAYGVTPMLRHGITGKGVTVAITDAFAAPTIVRDVRIYNRVHHQPQFRPGQFRQIHPMRNGYSLVDECGGNGWYGEETLDIEAVHAMAPGAKVVYIGAADCDGALDVAWATAIDNHVADVLTNSWGDNVDDVADIGQSVIDFYQTFSTEAALTGITVNFSSGDDGDYTGGGADPSAAHVGFPADLPYVTGVGGTSLEVGRHRNWKGEFGWQTDYSPLVGNSWGPPAYSSGGGGGTSQLFEQPFYQQGVVPTSMSEFYGPTPMRVVPDISMTGDPNTGMQVGETQVFPNGVYWDQYRIGGTSLSSPLLAGMVAVASQRAHQPLGFANPVYYRLLYTPALHDQIAPKHPVHQVRANFNNDINARDGRNFLLQTIDVQSSTLHDVPGYDNETGVGSPGGKAFFAGVNRLVGHR